MGCEADASASFEKTLAKAAVHTHVTLSITAVYCNTFSCETSAR